MYCIAEIILNAKSAIGFVLAVAALIAVMFTKKLVRLFVKNGGNTDKEEIIVKAASLATMIVALIIVII